ncbi:MAG TPA: PAS domain S-box protein [Burkholderiales bacterium]|nr:PAS domain S-box protein [Burkholderiales bacterium]
MSVRTAPLHSQTVDYLEGLLEGFVAYDAGWVMTYMNAAAERLLGRRREDVLGKSWHQAFPHAVGNDVDRMYQRVMRTRQPERMEYEYPHYARWFEISASPVRSGGIAVYFRDISDRETLNRIGRTLTAELDLERLVQAVTDAATEVAGAQFGAFFYNQKNEAGESYMLYALSGVARDLFAGFPMPRNTAVFAPTFAGEAIVRSADITSDPRYGRSAPHHGMPAGHLPVRSYLAVPVVSRSGEVLGGLFFGHADPGVFTDRAERLVAGIASQAATAIDNARLYRSLQESEQRFRTVLESQAEMVCRFRLDGTILFVNAAYARAASATPEAMVGRDFWTFIPDAERTRVRELLAQLTPQAPEVRIENRFVGADGERWTLWTNRALAFDAGGRVLEAQSSGVDITERKRAEEALREADRRKDEFLAMLAHELRNPLAPIRNGLHLLRLAEPGGETAEQARAMMERQLAHLIRLVDDLLEVSRISRGKIELKRERIDLGGAVRSAVEQARPALEASRHRLDIALPAEPLVLEADFVRLAQVVANLLNNAAKYTSSGGRVELAVRREGGEALISVRDNGIGIPQELLPRVFDTFAQAGERRGQAEGGLGIGLALARRLVELHGGRVEARSEGPGRGSEFVVHLPLTAPT